MRSIRPAGEICLLLLAACADEHADPAPDPAQASFKVAASGPVSCDTELEPLPLAAHPDTLDGEGASFFAQLGGACPGPLTSSLSLENTSDEVLDIDAVRSGGKPFEVEELALPLQLPPHARLPLRVRFAPEHVGESGAGLTIASGQRCKRVLLRGRTLDASDESVLSYSPLVLDFGELDPHTSATRSAVLLFQTGSGGPREVRTSAFSASPDAFQVLSPTGERQLRGCEPLPVTVRLSAAGSGKLEGWLSWSTLSTLRDGTQLDGLQRVELMATVR
jgi:hypothetical protein